MLTSPDQYRYIEGLDEIAIDGNVMDRRSGSGKYALRGEDIAYIGECIAARQLISGYPSNFQLVKAGNGGEIVKSRFVRKLAALGEEGAGGVSPCTAGVVLSMCNAIQAKVSCQFGMLASSSINPRDEVFGSGIADPMTSLASGRAWWDRETGTYYPVDAPKTGSPLRHEPIETILGMRLGQWDRLVISTGKKSSGGWVAVGKAGSGFSAMPRDFVRLEWDEDARKGYLKKNDYGWHDKGLYDEGAYTKKDDLSDFYLTEIKEGEPGSLCVYAERAYFQTHEKEDAQNGEDATVGEYHMTFRPTGSAILRAHFSNPEYISEVAPIYSLFSQCETLIDLPGSAVQSGLGAVAKWQTNGLVVGDWTKLDGNGECDIPLDYGRGGWKESPRPNYFEQLYNGSTPTATYTCDGAVDITYLGMADAYTRLENVFWMVRLSDDICNR